MQPGYVDRLASSHVTTSRYGASHTSGGNLHKRHEVDEVLRLIAEGWNNCQIERSTGISRSTVGTWRAGQVPKHGVRGIGRPSACPRCDGEDLDEPAYVYLLGLYLGDGHIVREPRTYRFSIYQDERYTQLIDLAATTIVRVRNGKRRVGFVRRSGYVAVTAHWNHWPCLFPQHGPGLKHRRPIRLIDWQEALVRRYPRQLLRGLIHSDGCRAINRVQRRKYAYVRYLFNNKSADIIRIFKEACDEVGVRYRDCRPDMVSVARRESVAMLDAFIGPKA